MNQNQWTAFKDIMAGSFGGMVGTFLGQPADVIKTRMQTMNFTNPIYTSNLHCVKEIVRIEGVGGFFKGIISDRAILFIFANRDKIIKNKNFFSIIFTI